MRQKLAWPVCQEAVAMTTSNIRGETAGISNLPLWGWKKSYWKFLRHRVHGHFQSSEKTVTLLLTSVCLRIKWLRFMKTATRKKFESFKKKISPIQKPHDLRQFSIVQFNWVTQASPNNERLEHTAANWGLSEQSTNRKRVRTNVSSFLLWCPASLKDYI